MTVESDKYRQYNTSTVNLAGLSKEPKSIPANQEPDTNMQDLQNGEFYD